MLEGENWWEVVRAKRESWLISNFKYSGGPSKIEAEKCLLKK